MATVASAGEGQGATFTVTFPALAAAAAAAPPAPALPGGTGSPRRVLIVDDNQDARGDDGRGGAASSTHKFSDVWFELCRHKHVIFEARRDKSLVPVML